MLFAYAVIAGLLAGSFFWFLYRHRGAAVGMGLVTAVGVWWFNG